MALYDPPRMLLLLVQTVYTDVVCVLDPSDTFVLSVIGLWMAAIMKKFKDPLYVEHYNSGYWLPGIVDHDYLGVHCNVMLFLHYDYILYEYILMMVRMTVSGVENAFSTTAHVMTLSFHKYGHGFFPGRTFLA